MKRPPERRPVESGEFLWLVSLSDLMILLFIFFVVMFSFTYKRLKESDLKQMVATLRNETPPANPVDEISRKFTEWVKKEKLDLQVTVTKTDDAVMVEIRDRVLFSSGESDPHREGIQTIALLAKTLEKIPEPFHIGIEGHTDDTPISTKTVRDNWELSAKRALSILYALNLSTNTLKRTVILAHGEMKPIVPNRTTAGIPIAENQGKNRRVTIRIF